MKALSDQALPPARTGASDSASRVTLFGPAQLSF
jgi:hypothetical protein